MKRMRTAEERLMRTSPVSESRNQGDPPAREKMFCMLAMVWICVDMCGASEVALNEYPQKSEYGLNMV